MGEGLAFAYRTFLESRFVLTIRWVFLRYTTKEGSVARFKLPRYFHGTQVVGCLMRCGNTSLSSFPAT